MKARRIVITGAAALALAAGGTAAGAAIAGPVGSDGIIHGCYDSGGNVKVVDASASCPKGYTPLNWSQTAQPGPPGPAGASVTVAQLQPGNTNCPTGGASLTDGSGNTAYVCNGADGATGPAGPQGPEGTDGITSILGAPCGDGHFVFSEDALVSQAFSAPFLSCG